MTKKGAETTHGHIAFYLHPETHAKLKLVAKLQHKTMKKIMSDIVEQYLIKIDMPPLSKKDLEELEKKNVIRNKMHQTLHKTMSDIVDQYIEKLDFDKKIKKRKGLLK